MGRYTSAYSAFVLRLDEVELLRNCAARKEKEDPIVLMREINALCRGGIVLLSSHLEAYIRGLGELALERMHTEGVPRDSIPPRFYYHISKDIVDEIKDTSDPDKIAGKLFTFLETDQSYWAQTGPFPKALPVDRFNLGFSSPAFDKITAYFNRFGYSGYRNDMARVLRADYTSTVNMVRHLVDIRNKIAHGDLVTTKTPGDVKGMIDIIRKYCATTDAVFASWCRSQLCSIR